MIDDDEIGTGTCIDGRTGRKFSVHSRYLERSNGIFYFLLHIAALSPRIGFCSMQNPCLFEDGVVDSLDCPQFGYLPNSAFFQGRDIPAAGQEQETVEFRHDTEPIRRSRVILRHGDMMCVRMKIAAGEVWLMGSDVNRWARQA